MLIIIALLLINTVTATEENVLKDVNNNQENTTNSIINNAKNNENNLAFNKNLNTYTQDNFKESTDSTTTEKKDSFLSIDNINDTKYNEKISISGKFTNEDGKSLINSKIKLNINNINQTLKTDDAGRYYTTYKTSITGLNNITVSYPGNTKYNPTNTTTTFTVNKKDTKITINSPKTVKYNDKIALTGKFTNEDGNALVNSNIKLTINGVTHTVKTDDEGMYNYTFNTNNIGKNNITASYAGNTKYNGYNLTTTFTVKKKDTQIILNTIAATKYHDVINITGTFTNEDGTKLKNSNLKLQINDKIYTVKTNDKGIFTFEYKTTIVGKNNVTTSYPGNTKYNPTNTTTTFTVNKKDTKISLKNMKTVEPGDKVTATGKLLTKDNIPLSNSNIIVYVNGAHHTVKTDINGTYNYTFTAKTEGMNNITVSYPGNTKYNSYNITKTVNVLKKVDPDVRLANSEIHPGVDKVFFALLPYDATGTVIFKINTVSISGKLPVEDGQVLYIYKIPESYTKESYTLYMIYSGDEQYNNRTVNATLTVTPENGKINATISMDNTTTKYLSTIPLTVKLNETSFGNVTFKINDTNTNNTINKTVKVINGTATYNYAVKIIPGVYNITATYNGNYMYYPANITSTLTVNRLNSKIELKNMDAKAGNLTFFTATVIDELNRTVKNMNVTFKINDEVIGTNVTNSKGVVKLYYTIPPYLDTKKNNLTAISTPTNTTYGAKNDSTITLKQLKTSVMVPSINTKPSKTITITATVIDEFNNYVPRGTVTFIKDNQTLARVNVSNGFAKFAYTANYQISNLTQLYAEYTGDWKYASSKGNGSYQVTKLKTSTLSSSIDAKPNSEITFSARIIDQNQQAATEGTVRFTLANKYIGNASVKNGVASLKYNLNNYKCGEYRIISEYLESNIYLGSDDTNVMSVSRYDIRITGNEVNAEVGALSSISLKVVDEERYNVNQGTMKFYITSEYIGSANISNGVSTIEFVVPNKYDGKIVKYYASYEENDLYESSSYSNTITVSHQKIVYVDPNGSDSNLGDKTHPFKTLQYAINHITLFGTIYLSEGTFSASGISINSSLNIIGKGMTKTFIDGQKSGSSIFNISKKNAVLSLANLTIKNGESNSEFSAGAIFTSSKLNINNVRFVNNTGSGAFSGGAIYTNGILNLTNCEFINNKVTNVNSQGGAIRTYGNSTYITNCKFDSNKVTGTNTTGGSVLYADSSEIVINNTVFTKNSASGRYITGGLIRTINGLVVIVDSTFTNNNVTATDYAVGGIIGSLSSGVSILNTTFNSNNVKASNIAGGGVVYVETAALDVKNSKLNSNKLVSKEAYGGAIYTYNAFTTLIGNQVNNNQINATTTGFGGAIYTLYGNMTIEKTNFTSNSVKAQNVSLAGALYTYSNVTINNSNFEKNNVNASNLGGGAIANMGNLNATKTNFIDNNAVNCGNAITTTATAKNTIENNYWGSADPSWNELLYVVTKPKNYSKTKFNN